jgi:hypothetical protein
MRRPGRPIGISWRAIARVLAWATDVLTVKLFVLGTGGMGLVFFLVALGQAWLRVARRNSWGA